MAYYNFTNRLLYSVISRLGIVAGDNLGVSWGDMASSDAQLVKFYSRDILSPFDMTKCVYLTWLGEGV